MVDCFSGALRLKNEEIFIDNYNSYVKIIHKVVLDIYWVVVLIKAG